MRVLQICIVVSGMFLVVIGTLAQDGTSTAESQTVTCTFSNGKEMTVRYVPAPVKKDDRLRSGEALMPGGSAMVLFTGAELKLGGTTVPVGAYTIYVIPGRKAWTLVVSKNEKPEAKYDPKQDLARADMETAPLERFANPLAVSFTAWGIR